MYYADSSPLVRAQLSNGLLSETVSNLLILTEAGPEVLDKVKGLLNGLDEFLKRCSQDPRALTPGPLVYTTGSDIRDWVLEDSSSALEAIGCMTTEPLLVDERRSVITLQEFREIVSSLDSEM